MGVRYQGKIMTKNQFSASEFGTLYYYSPLFKVVFVLSIPRDLSVSGRCKCEKSKEPCILIRRKCSVASFNG